MGKLIRIFIAIVVVLSFMIWSRSAPAGAANAGSTGDPSLQMGVGLSVSPDKHDDCEKGKNKDKCPCGPKDKDKGRDPCECKDKEKKPCGTVKPPHPHGPFCEPGNFSLGGVAVLNVNDLGGPTGKKPCFEGRVEDSEELQLPKDAGPALSDTVTLTALEQDSRVEICFAAPPGKQVTIYLVVNSSWKALDTQVKNGVACTRVPGSGSFVVAGV